MLALGSDHSAVEMKKAIMKYLDEEDIGYKDFGTYSKESCDYPIYAKKVASAILSGECDRGILICSTGIGISITANRYAGIRAALCMDCFMAKAARDHNDANILVLGAKITDMDSTLKITDTFLNTPFSGDERHKRRINLIEEIL